MSDFVLEAPYLPAGDQPHAISELVNGVLSGNRFQTLYGVTGSGKTFTLANIIAALNLVCSDVKSAPELKDEALQSIGRLKQ